MSKDTIHLTGIAVENFRRLRVAEVQYVPERGLIRVTGPNRSGKTSLLKAVAGPLGGAGEVSEASLHDGEEAGFTRLELTNGYTVERRYSEANPKGYLAVVGPDGKQGNQTLLNTWLGERSFDPLAFFSLPARRQREVLFEVAEDPKLPEKLAEIDEAYQETYEQRTPIISRRQALERVKEPEGERPQPVDVSAEMARHQELQGQQESRREVEQKLKDTDRKLKELRDEGEKTDQRIQQLEDQLRKAKERREAISGRLEKGAGHRQSLVDTLEGMEDPSEEISQIQERISNANEAQENLEPWREWDRAQEELPLLKADEKELTESLRQLEDSKEQLLQDAGIPVEGLSFDSEGQPLLHGRPLDVASGRERIEVAVQVAMAADPAIRVCLLDEANDLDEDGIKRLDEMAREHDFQIFAVRLGLEGQGEIVVDDGAAWGSENGGPPEPEPATEPSPVEEQSAGQEEAPAAESEEEPRMLSAEEAFKEAQDELDLGEPDAPQWDDSLPF